MSPVSLTLQNKQIRLKILQGSLWTQEITKVKSLSSRKYDPTTTHWVIPSEYVLEIKEKWDSTEMFYTDKVTEEFFNRVINTNTKPILEMAPILRHIEAPVELKPFQSRYIRLNESLRKLILAAGPGTGKTLTSVMRYQILGDKSLLIVCPKILRVNWQETLRQMFGKSAVVYWGTTKQKSKIDTSGEIVITTYEALPSLTRRDFEHVILDEAHLLSNPTKQRFKGTVQVINEIPDLKSIQLLTGTPIQHKPRNLWSLMHIVAPHLAGSYINWCNEYEEVVKMFRKEITLKDKKGNIIRDREGKPKIIEKEIPLITRTRNLHKLRAKLKSIMYMVTREDALECKEAAELVYLDLLPDQERLYHQIKNEILVELENKTLAIQHAPVRMLRLLQVCEGMFNFSETNTSSTKLEYLSHEIENNDDKLVVWTRFQPLTWLLQEMYPDKVVIYNGDVSDNLKQLGIWAFNGVDDDVQLETYKKLQDKAKFRFNPGEAKIWVGVINERSSLGFNLHRQCNRQILTSYNFLSSANYQATSRLIRIGQQQEFVSTEYLVARNTIDSSALQLILRNFETAMKIVEGEEAISTKDTRQLINLLQQEA